MLYVKIAFIFITVLLAAVLIGAGAVWYAEEWDISRWILLPPTIVISSTMGALGGHRISALWRNHTSESN